MLVHALAFAALLGCSDCWSVAEEQFGNVTVIATDSTGANLGGAEVEFTPVHGGDAIRARSMPARLRYGDYRMTVHRSGFRSGQVDVRVYQAEMVMRVELGFEGLGECPGPPSEIAGRVNRGGRELWAKAIRLRGFGGSEVRVGENGFFLISGLDLSDYILLIVRESKVLHQQIVRTTGSGKAKPLSIDLPQ